jgi:hypothetical protein
MTHVKRALLIACMIAAFTDSAMAQGIDVAVGVGIPLSPGQTGTSPGRVFNTAKDYNPTTALSPGRLFIKDRETNPTTALAPGHTFTNFGRSKK